MKQFDLTTEPDRLSLKNFGQVAIWCSNDKAPSQPERKTLGTVKTIGRHELVLVDGIECEARQVEPAVSKDKSETRFLAVRVNRDGLEALKMTLQHASRIRLVRW